MDAAEKRHVEYYLGNSVMNPETRLIVNEKGFCRRHFPMMREAGHAHHLGLLGHTHLQNIRVRLASHLKTLSRNGSPRTSVAFADKIDEITGSCLICESLNRDESRYAYTAVILHNREAEFRRLFEASPGPCLPHAASLARMAGKELGKKDAPVFLKALAEHMDSALENLEADILRFTQKFDAQNDSLDWGSSRDAHARTVQMLSGRTVRLED